MEWTNEKPTVPGFYWVSHPNTEEQMIVYVDFIPSTGLGMLSPGDTYFHPVEATAANGLWYGPLVAPPFTEDTCVHNCAPEGG